MVRKQSKDEAHSGSKGKRPITKTSEPKKWVVVILESAKKEGHKILTDPQYEYIKGILKRLTDFGNDEELSDLRIEPIEDFGELKEKGGVLGKINLRIYFGAEPEDKEVVVAKAYKKEDEGRAPRHVVIAVQNRLEEYRIEKKRRRTAKAKQGAVGTK